MAVYLVTGGCGFIGSHLADALVADGHAVRILDDLSTGKRENAPTQADVRIGDVGNRDTVGDAMDGVDGCFHLAAIASVERSNEDWLGTHRANLTGAINVFDAARTANAAGPVPVVYASSAAIYGDNEDIPLGEDAAPRPLTAYGADKLGCEHHGRVATVVHGVPTTGFRFFNIYGPRQDPKSPYSGVISIFADRLAAGAPITIHGDGEQFRDFVFVDDCVAHLVAGMARASDDADVYNVATGRTTTVNELLSTLADLTGRTPDASHGPARTGDIRRSAGDPARATEALGVSADTRLADGLRTLVDSLGDA